MKWLNKTKNFIKTHSVDILVLVGIYLLAYRVFTVEVGRLFPHSVTDWFAVGGIMAIALGLDVAMRKYIKRNETQKDNG